MKFTNFQLDGLDSSHFSLLGKQKSKESKGRMDFSKNLGSMLIDNYSNMRNPDNNSSLYESLNIYQLKDTYKDKKKIKDAVTVKKMNLFNKQNMDQKKISSLISYNRKVSLQFAQKPLIQKCSPQKQSLKMERNNSLLMGLRSGIRTMTYSSYPQNSSAMKLQSVRKDLEISNTLIKSTPAFCSKSDALLNVKLKSYVYSIKEGRKFHGLNEEIYKEPLKKQLKVRVGKGNNSTLIKWLFKKRWWWAIDDEKQNRQKSKVNFIWTQLKQKQFFEIPDQDNKRNLAGISELNDISVHNHFPLNQYLGNKKALFYNMSFYYQRNNINVFQKLPLTFHVISLQDESWKKFSDIFDQRKKNEQNNIWILKPGQNSNRGRGITVHTSYQQIKEIIKESQAVKESNNNEKTKDRTYIIQSYIDKPFLYNKRKFDIRSYMLLVNINKTIKGYWYSQGYIRTSSFQFQLNNFDTFIHLTNDAIQTNSENYGKYEEGNKISYAQFQKYLDSKYLGSNFDIQKQIVPQMKQIATESIKAAAHLVKGDKLNKPVFQIFGLDFMIDKDFKPWLIQINTNPCIETSCLVLQKVIPKMLDDAFKLSLDLIFPPPQNWPASRKHCLPSSDNKFQLIFDQSKEQINDNINLSLPTLGEISQDSETYQQKQTNNF